MKMPTNTSGTIAAAAKKQAAPKALTDTPAQILDGLLSNERVQNQISDATKGNIGAFSASLLNLFNSDPKLQLCDPKAVIVEALKAATLGLPIEKSLGLAYIVPFWDSKINGYSPQFMISYTGLIQLCARTGEYKYINADAVYEGEYRGSDKLTGCIDLNGKKTSDRIIGYFAYFETLKGYRKAVFWDKERVWIHANTYSKSKDKQGNLIGPWVSNFNEMAVKTVLRNLLKKYALKTVELEKAFEIDAEGEEISQDQSAGSQNSEINTSGAVEISTSETGISEPPPSAEISAPEPYPFTE